eukprot:gene9935-3115_t
MPTFCRWCAGVAQNGRKWVFWGLCGTLYEGSARKMVDARQSFIQST